MCEEPLFGSLVYFIAHIVLDRNDGFWRGLKSLSKGKKKKREGKGKGITREFRGEISGGEMMLHDGELKLIH